MRARNSLPFVLEIEVADDVNDTCSYQGTHTQDPSVVADVQLCPEVVRIILIYLNDRKDKYLLKFYNLV